MKTWTWKEALQTELMDGATKTGGVSYQGERLDNFLIESGMMSVWHDVREESYGLEKL